MKHKRQGQGSKNCDENGSKSSSCGNEDEDSLDGLHGKESQGRRRIKCESGGRMRRQPGPGSCGNEDEDSGSDDDMKGGSHVADHDLDKLLPSPEDMDHSLSSKEDQQTGQSGALPAAIPCQRLQPPVRTPPSLLPESRIPQQDKHFYPTGGAFDRPPAAAHATYDSATDFACSFPQQQQRADYHTSSYPASSYFDSHTYASGYPSGVTVAVDGSSNSSSTSSSASPFQSGSTVAHTVPTFSHNGYYNEAADVQSRENLTPNVENDYNNYCMSYSGNGGGHSVPAQRSYYENYSSCQYRESPAGSQRSMYSNDVYPETHTYSSSGYQQQQHQSDHTLSQFSNQSSAAVSSVPTNQSPIIDPYVQSNNYFEMISAVNF